MERVVYFLGAGFSAPLGLPVMSNFLEKSKDLYFKDPSEYPGFKEVIDTINRMAVAKNFYKTDLLNIEEILSILAMERSVTGKKLQAAFVRYVVDVIQAFTPAWRPHQGGRAMNWHGGIFRGNGQPAEAYGFFVGSVLQLRITSYGSSYFEIERKQDSPIEYSLVTLNYDMVLENYAKWIRESFSNRDDLIGFSRPGAGSDCGYVTLAKLHGSADTGTVVAPTWSKALEKKLLPAWQAALDLLVNANHVRIIGYSLPTADAYIKYLLRAAAIKAPHLKRIDVLCLDDKHDTVRRRYDDFIDFSSYRFVNGDVVKYLAPLRQRASSRAMNEQVLDLDGLEEAHESYFGAQAS